MLVATFGLKASGTAATYSDVNADAWYASFVSAAAANGIITGYSDGTFKPNAPISRAEMATMAARAMKVALQAKAVTNGEELLKNTFQDASGISASMQADVALAVKKGLILGVKEGTFDPNGKSNRAQAAVILYRLFNLK
jgi:hypothetical protein